MRFTQKYLALLLLLCLTGKTNAQIAGAFNVPSNFPTIAAAITTLNFLGVAGPVTINVTAGHTETATAGGYKLFNVAGSSATNTILFQKSGGGANPQITAYTGTATPSTANQDGVWWFIGTDYVTIDGIDIFDPNTTNPATMEFGYGFFKASGTDGCQHNTIKNCTITLNQVNGAAGSGPSAGGSRGINLVNSTFSTQITNLTSSSPAGGNSYNKFYSNLIQKCHIGVAVMGYQASSPYTNSDWENDIGGITAATGNTIINFGGGTGSDVHGIRTLAQYSFNASFNLLDNNNGSGLSPVTWFHAMLLGYAPGASSSITSNTISLMRNTSSNQALHGIYNQSGNAINSNTVDISYNVFTGLTYSNSTGGSFTLIHNEASSSVTKINFNLISNVIVNSMSPILIHNVANSSSTSINSNTITNYFAVSGIFRGITFTNPSNITSENNIIDGVTISSGGHIYCIEGNVSAAIANVNGNRIKNIASGNNASIYGILFSSGTGQYTVTENEVSNVSSYPGLNLGFNFYGIYFNQSNSTLTMNSNTVNAVMSSGTTTTNVNSFFGFYFSGSTITGRINQNKIYSLTNNLAGFVDGIRIVSGTYTISNNLIGDLHAPFTSNTSGVNGISIQSGTSSLFYNSVNLNTPANSGNFFGSTAFSVSTSANWTIRNNIFVNTSVSTGTGITSAIRASSTSTTSFNAASNNNLLYAGTPAANRVIFYNGTTTYSTLPLFKSLIAPREAQSVTENPPFLTTNGSSPFYLTLNPSIPTQVESGASPIPGYTTDYASSPRNALSPDIGAWEGNYIQADIFPPVLLGSGFTTGACNLSGRTFTANISDASGVGSGSVAPRVYYKVNFSLYTSVQGVLSSGTASNGVWTFNLTYAALPTDVIHYFLAIQDQSPLNNFTLFPSAGSSATDVNTVFLPPSPANTYSIASGTLNGNYTVGTGQTYTNLSAAAFAYNTSCITGPVTFILTDASYSQETLPIEFGYNTDASPTRSLLIRPAVSVAATISGTNTFDPAVIKLHNAKYVTIDGINNSGSSLTVFNPNMGASAGIWLASSPALDPGNAGINIRRLTIRGNSNTNPACFGILSAANGASVSTAGGTDNDQVNIEFNTILRTGNAIYAAGTTTVSMGGLDSWNISSNIIGPVASGTGNIGASGIFIQNALGPVISGNIIRNLQTSSTGVAGININSGVISPLVTQNTISAVNSSAFSNSISAICGIYIGNDVTGAQVIKNVITGVVNNNNSGQGARGIIINTGSNASSFVNNNMISGVASYGNNTATSWPAGIAIDGTSGGIDIDYNTVNMYGSYIASTSSLISTAVLMNGTGGNIKLRNNLLANTYDFTGFTNDKNYALYSLVSPGNFSAIDNNNYYVGGSLNIPVPAHSAGDLNNLAAIQLAFGGNLNSKTVSPSFVSASDLHLLPIAQNAGINGGAQVIGGIGTDIDNQPRSLTVPDIGADEFVVTPCTSPAPGSITVTSHTLCNGQQVSLSATGTSGEDGIQFQWQFSPVSGGSYTNVTGGSGATSTSFTSAALSAGVYFSVLKTTCLNTSFTTVTNEATVSVLALPTASASASSGTYCAGNTVSLSASSNSATTYSWIGPNGFISSSQFPVIVGASPAASGTYSLVASSGACNSALATVAVAVNPNPTITVTGNTVICSGGSTTLTANGAGTYTWSTGANSASVSVSPLTATIYTVTGSNGGLCNGNRTVSVISNTVPVISVASQSASVCYSTQASFTANGANTYTWNTGQQGGILTATPTAPAIFTVSGTNIQGCNATATVAVGIFTAPVLGISANSFTVCPNNQITFTASGASTYTWNGITTGAVINFTPAANTIYSLSGTNSQGCKSSTITFAYVHVVPPILVSSSAPSVCLGNSVTLTSAGASTYTWSHGPNGAVVSVAPGTSTIYNVNGTFTNGCTGTGSVNITVHNQPIVSVSPPAVTVCIQSPVNFVASGASTYTWSFGANGQNATYTPISSGVFTVTGASAQGCVGSTLVSVTSQSLPTVQVIASSASVCALSNVTLVASGAANYTWTGGGTGAQLIVTPSVNTVYTVTGNNGQGCNGSASVAVTAFSIPIVSIAQSATTACISTAISFTATGANTYSWSNGATIPSQVITLAGPINLTVTGTNNNGCGSKATASVVPLPSPTLTTVQSATAVCPGLSISFTASGAANYTWSSGQTGHIASFSPTVSTTYSLTGADLNNCKSTVTQQVEIHIPPAVTANATKTNVCSGDSVTLAGGGATTYTWSGGIQNNTPFYPSLSATYSVAGTGTNGCQGTATVEILIVALPIVTATGEKDTVCAGEAVTLLASGAVTYSWNPEGGSGASVIVMPGVTTMYTVTGFDQNNCAGIAQVTIHTEECTGLGEETWGRNFRVYPVPARDRIFVELPDIYGVRIELYDVSGRKVMEMKPDSDLQEIDLSEFSQGMYTLFIFQSSEAVKGLKLLKAN